METVVCLAWPESPASWACLDPLDQLAARESVVSPAVPDNQDRMASPAHLD